MSSTCKYSLLLLVTVSVVLFLGPPNCEAKIYKMCDVVRKLEENGVQKLFIPTYACLTEHESNYNSSSKTGPTAALVTSYGIFQINNKRWCRDAFRGGDCNVKCEDLLKDDLKASIACAKIRMEAVGFKDWPTFESKCKPNKLPNIRHCIS